jgi:ABC-type lipoprotein export system ATPase subunit
VTGIPLLETRNVGLAYATDRGPIRAVDDVTIQVAAGECVAICGRSGSGKSTLLSLLGGLARPTSGTVLYAGRPWTELSAAEVQAARSGGIGLLWQESVLLPGLTALDNVVLPQLVAGHPRAAACARAERMLERVGMRERWDAHPAELSGGQQRRVALARALATEPRLILADEPTNDLDAHAEAEIVRLLAEIREAGTTAIVLVTHDPAVAAIADRRLWMERGRIVDGAKEAAPRPAPRIGPLESSSSAAVRLQAFEPAAPDLVPQTPAVATADWRRTVVPFALGLGVAAAAIAGIDRFVARRQEVVVETIREQRRLAEEMALQDLRADIDDIAPVGADGFTATLFLENYRPERPLHVLGPATGVAVQRDGRWEGLPAGVSPAGVNSTGASQAAREIRRVGADRLLMPVSFSLPAGPYDELLRGYLHVRISASLVVGDRDDGTGDLFERSDAYYVYLRDPRLTEDAIRAANGWGAKAAVPLWIPMPAH